MVTCLACGCRKKIDFTKQGQPQAIFFVAGPRVRQKRHHEWVKRVNRVIEHYLHCVAQLLKTILRHQQLELLDNANGCKHSKQ